VICLATKPQGFSLLKGHLQSQSFDGDDHLGHCHFSVPTSCPGLAPTCHLLNMSCQVRGIVAEAPHRTRGSREVDLQVPTVHNRPNHLFALVGFRSSVYWDSQPLI
jgi:hypothetical protein